MSPARSHHDRLAEALRSAHAAGRGVPPELEPLVREYAASRRAAGDPVERILVEVKTLLRDTVGADVDMFKHRVIGWTVAGYFAASSKSESSDVERDGP